MKNSDEKEAYYRWLSEYGKRVQEKYKEMRFQHLKNENDLEKYFMWQLEKIGGLAIKLNPTGNSGIPDLLILHRGASWFVEMKTGKGEVRPNQREYHRKLNGHGFPVQIIRNRQQVDDFIIQL